MRKGAWLLTVGLLAAGCAPSANVEQERNALMEQDRAWSQTTKDLEKFLTYYAPDASVFVPGMPIATGTAPIREAFTKLTSMPGFLLQWTVAKADAGTSGDLGYTSGAYEMSVNDATGKPTTDKGKYVTVWKKQTDGQWKVVADIFNSDAPPPAPVSDLTIGAWRLNAAKSTYKPGPGPKSLTLRIESLPEGRKVTSDGIGPTGNATHSEHTAKFDGNDYPIKGDPDLETVAFQPIDAYSYDRIGKKAGKVVQTLHIVVSKDGKTVTASGKGTNAQGQAYDSVQVFEKQ